MPQPLVHQRGHELRADGLAGVVLTDAVHRDDARVFQPGRHHRLAEEPPAAAGIGGPRLTLSRTDTLGSGSPVKLLPDFFPGPAEVG